MDRIGDAVDVVEVGDHLDRVVDRVVVEASRAQGLHVGLGHLGGPQGELLRVLAERSVRLGEPSAAPVGLYGRQELGALRLGELGELITEVPGVRERSVVTVVQATDHRREELALVAP